MRSGVHRLGLAASKTDDGVPDASDAANHEACADVALSHQAFEFATQLRSRFKAQRACGHGWWASDESQWRNSRIRAVRWITRGRCVDLGPTRELRAHRRTGFVALTARPPQFIPQLRSLGGTKAPRARKTLRVATSGTANSSKKTRLSKAFCQ